jgi:hypothetical protein
MNELGIGIEYRKQMLALMVAGWFLGMGYIMYTLVR